MSRKLSGSIVKIPGWEKYIPDSVRVCKYIYTPSRRHLASSVARARTCKYEFSVFARFQLCNALSQYRSLQCNERTRGEEKRYLQIYTRTSEQGLYRRLDRSGFAAEPRINRRCGKADTRALPLRMTVTTGSRAISRRRQDAVEFVPGK